MHPAPSIIVFSTLSGLGFGLMAWLGLGLVPPAGAAFAWGAGLALALAVLGLCASVLHLARPDRAWRALSQWRSSWLSREGALALLTLLAFAGFAGGALAGRPLAPLGWLAAASAALTVHATAMIYASLRAVPLWRTPLTPACYLAFAAAGGALLAALLGRASGAAGGAGPELLAGALLLLAWGLKAIWWRRVAAEGPSSRGTATGLGAIGAVRPLEPPHTGPNYLTREMIHRIGRRRARALRRVALALGLALPFLCLVLSALAGGSAVALAVAAPSLLLGLMAERWLFFAEARHVVGLYYAEPAP